MNSLIDSIKDQLKPDGIWVHISIHPQFASSIHLSSTSKWQVADRTNGVLPPAWIEAMGSGYSSSIRDASLHLLSNEELSYPYSLSDEVLRMRERAYRLHIALRICGVEYRNKDVLVIGTSERCNVVIRTVEYLHVFPVGYDTYSRPLNNHSFTEAAYLSEKIAVLEESTRHERLKKCWGALQKGLTEKDGWESLHQFVRALEGLTGAQRMQSASEFARRMQAFVPDSLDDMLALYNLRSLVEHMNDIRPLRAAFFPKAQTEDEAILRANQLFTSVTSIACQVFKMYLTHPELKTRFAETGQLRNFSDIVLKKAPKYAIPNVSELQGSWKTEIFSEQLD